MKKKRDKDDENIPNNSQQTIEIPYNVNTSHLKKEKKEIKKDSKRNWKILRTFQGHRDGVWELSTSEVDHNFLGSASSDRTAKIFCIDGSHCDIVYIGHKGSVNTIRFHPKERIACTASGDNQTHIWKIPSYNKLTQQNQTGQQVYNSPNDELIEEEDDEKDDFKYRESVDEFWSPILSDGVNNNQTDKKKKEAMSTPQKSLPTSQTNEINISKSSSVILEGHTDTVVGAEWLNSNKIVTVSWDKTIKLWDADSGYEIQSLDCLFKDITNKSTVSVHTATNIVSHHVAHQFAVPSTDGYIRIWDSRSSDDSPTFCWLASSEENLSLRHAMWTKNGEHFLTGGDCKHVKLWDCRNIKSPIHQIKNKSAVNKFSLSNHTKKLAIPMDDRKTKVCNFEGERFGHLQTYSKGGHKSFISSTAWSVDDSVIFTSSFDQVRSIIAWSLI
eukprot:TRINITY_DN10442_c0_g1_i1.p1 TRINITY_DN10442_c0_g1~~TRINITY_DN10442_c0_g1_i1.p1  ORF type:complete len:510 (+),score=107.67 TRINITY_DN10442_c0_g1_i1:204-1532(+)